MRVLALIVGNLQYASEDQLYAHSSKGTYLQVSYKNQFIQCSLDRDVQRGQR